MFCLIQERGSALSSLIWFFKLFFEHFSHVRIWYLNIKICHYITYLFWIIGGISNCGEGEEISLLDPSEEEKLRKKSWLVAAGGKNPKRRVYGVGKLNENYLCWEVFTQQPFSSTSMDSQKILRLEEEIRQSREEFRQSREENQRLQRKLESLVIVVLFLPSHKPFCKTSMNNHKMRIKTKMMLGRRTTSMGKTLLIMQIIS